MTEKQLFKRLMKHFGIVILLFIAITFVMSFVCSKNLVEPLNGFSTSTDSGQSISAADISINAEDPDIVNITLFDKNGVVYSNVEGLQKGETWIEYTNTQTGEIIDTANYKVLANHMVADSNSGNYSNWTLQRNLILLLLLALTVMLWGSFFTAQKKAGYSYHAIFCSGFGIWLIYADVMTILFLRTNMSMSEFYSHIQSFACHFLLYSAPVLTVFAVILSISNISLIRHEGFRMRNALGIIISAIMVLAAVCFGLLYFRDFSGSELAMRIWNTFYSTYASVYCLIECFLLGAIICGTLASRHEPAHDKDYIVILGCKVAKDGHLYPLIRGRVDRAIRFQKAQFEKTGKKAIFVPSGGKGGDEPLSEAEAMKRYLLEQGFTEEDVMIEDQSKNTMENMKFSKKLIEERTPGAKAAFSTTNFHVFRSGIISRQQNFPAEGMGSDTKWYFWPNAYVREMIGMISYCRKALIILLICLCLFFAFLAFQ